MDGMVEENGTAGNPGGDPLAHSPGDTNTSVVVTSVQSSSSEQHHLVAATSIVQLTLPTHVNNSTATAQVQSVIQANQQSVIQTPANIQPVQLQKGNVILVSKPNSVIQTAQGSLQTLQVVDAGSDDSLSNDDDSTKKRRDILTRRPSYRKILNDLGGGEIAVGRGESSSEVDTNEDSELSSHSIPSHYQTHTTTVTFDKNYGLFNNTRNCRGYISITGVPEFCPAEVLLHASKSADMSLKDAMLVSQLERWTYNPVDPGSIPGVSPFITCVGQARGPVHMCSIFEAKFDADSLNYSFSHCESNGHVLNKLTHLLLTAICVVKVAVQAYAGVSEVVLQTSRDDDEGHMYQFEIRNPGPEMTESKFKVCHGSPYAVMWLVVEPREFSLPTLPQRCIMYVPEKLPSKYGVHSEEYLPILIPAGAIQIASQGETVQGLHTLTMTNATTAGGAIVQYAQGQDGQFFVPVVTQGGGIGGGPIIAEDQARKREMRLLKNREAARECRRKKKEYIKCLENRVAVLENQNKALIEELKSLKELYCQQKTD
ncbi:hypothetical protein ANN_04372 [Periplaneta americana]|uniref:Cyclic AMP-responsive element-binding protein 1 n=1 Tax=Periplaneta americana TaxID=6978 RepID=A0ABQ8T8E1_PERAM|nr:hypothetical protein ANN_04372 [Periplaneta americana]